MMRALTVLVALSALALLAGCGSSSDKKTIPTADGARLIRALRTARDLAGDPAKCPQLQTAAQTVQARVAVLPASVDKNTRDSLVNGVNHLIDDVRSECQNVPTTPTTTETTPTTPTQTVPTDTQPTQTQPTPPTATTPTTPTTETTPPGNGGVSPGNTPQVPKGQGKKGKKQKGGGEG
jgi:outer membrane murein-binding lipoprotein Lpp